MSQLQYGLREQPSAAAGYSMPDVEYAADFILLAKRHLSAQELAAFTLFFTERRGWAYCCRQLNLDRGSFFHTVYRVEEILGRACAETEPYPLFPLDCYFAGVRHKPDTGLPEGPSATPLVSVAA